MDRWEDTQAGCPTISSGSAAGTREGGFCKNEHEGGLRFLILRKTDSPRRMVETMCPHSPYEAPTLSSKSRRMADLPYSLFILSLKPSTLLLFSCYIVSGSVTA